MGGIDGTNVVCLAGLPTKRQKWSVENSKGNRDRQGAFTDLREQNLNMCGVLFKALSILSTYVKTTQKGQRCVDARNPEPQRREPEVQTFLFPKLYVKLRRVLSEENSNHKSVHAKALNNNNKLCVHSVRN